MSGWICTTLSTAYWSGVMSNGRHASMNIAVERLRPRRNRCPGIEWKSASRSDAALRAHLPGSPPSKVGLRGRFIDGSPQSRRLLFIISTRNKKSFLINKINRENRQFFVDRPGRPSLGSTTYPASSRVLSHVDHGDAGARLGALYPAGPAGRTPELLVSGPAVRGAAGDRPIGLMALSEPLVAWRDGPAGPMSCATAVPIAASSCRSAGSSTASCNARCTACASTARGAAP